MTRIGILAVGLMGLSSCILYTSPERGKRVNGEHRPQATEDGHDTYTLRLDPDSVQAGDTVIVSLRAEGLIDLNEVVGLQFYGPSNIDILAESARGPAEYLLTIAVPVKAPSGPNDLIIDTQSGLLTLDNAMLVHGQEPAETGGDTGGDTGRDTGRDTGADTSNAETGDDTSHDDTGADKM